MAKIISLVRHAKAVAVSEGMNDIDRSLIERGIEQAQSLGQYILSRDEKYDRILCSPSKRTIQTYQYIQSVANNITDYSTVNSIYRASTKDIENTLKSLDDATNNVMVIGHNPGLEDYLIERCSGDGEFRQWLEKGLKTASIVITIADCNNWSELSKFKLKAINYFRGKSKNYD